MHKMRFLDKFLVVSAIVLVGILGSWSLAMATLSNSVDLQDFTANKIIASSVTTANFHTSGTSSFGSFISFSSNSAKYGKGTKGFNNLIVIAPDKNYAAGTNKNGALYFDNTLNARQAINIVSYAPAGFRSSSLLSIENLSDTDGQGSLLITSVGRNGRDYDIMMNGPNPDIEFCDTDYDDSYGCGEVDFGPVKGTSTAGALRFNLRNDADNSFINFAGLSRLPNNRAYFYINNATAGLTVGWQDSDLDFSLGKIQVNSNATSPTKIDLSNTIAIGTGTGGASASEKYLGQFGWVSRDSSFSSPKLVAYIGAEATENYEANTDVGSLLRFYAGTANGANPTEKMVISGNGRVGIGTSTPISRFSVSDSATTTIFFDSTGVKGTCLVMKDSDGSGYTYIVAKNGALQASTNDCR